MADTLRNIGAQMANVMFNLSQRPGDALTGDHVATMDSLRKQWDAAVRATPPSPSTAPEVKTWQQRYDELSKILPSPKKANTQLTALRAELHKSACRDAEIAELRAALASRPAEMDDEGLPALPESEFCAWLQNGQVVNAFTHGVGEKARWDHDGHWASKGYDRAPLYTAEQYRQGQRDAVAAYKRKHDALQELADQAQENDMGYGDAVAADRARREKGGA